jgi:hypothetical protein
VVLLNTEDPLFVNAFPATNKTLGPLNVELLETKEPFMV